MTDTLTEALDVPVEAALPDDRSLDEVFADDGAVEDTPTEAAEPDEPALEDEDDAPEAAAEPAPIEKPFDYTVDGQAKTYDGIKVLVGADGKPTGAVIPAERIAEIQQRLSRHDHYESANKELYAQAQQFNRVEFKGADGAVAKGMAAVEGYVAENAKLAAAVKLFADSLDFEKPDKLIALAYAAQNGDRSEFDRLIRDVRAEARDAEWAARQNFGRHLSTAAQNETIQQDRASITTAALTGSIETHAKQFPSLTPADIAAAKAQFARLGSAVVRPATPDEAQVAGVKPGELIVDHPVIYEWLKDRSELRAEQAKAAAVSSKASTENAKKLAAARLPKTAGKSPAKARQTVPADAQGMTWAQQRDALLSGAYTGADTE